MNTTLLEQPSLDSANELLLQGSIRDAQAQLLTLLAASPNDVRVSNNYAVTAIAAGEHRVATAILQHLSVDHPLDADVQRHLAIAAEAGLANVRLSNGTERRRLLVLSLLFNWPTTGGGNIHTAELCEFLSNAGYEITHAYVVSPELGVGSVSDPTDYRRVPILVSKGQLDERQLRKRIRLVAESIDPHSVIVTDSWSAKVLLAEAVAEFPYYIRLAAQECICPLNNVRLLVSADGLASSCPESQLKSPGACRACVHANGGHTGALHQAERALAGFSRDDYPERLKSAFNGAEAVFVVNPMIAKTVEEAGYSANVIPSGFNSARFRVPENEIQQSKEGKNRILFAGLANDYLKGFHVLRRACEILWEQEVDFELYVTSEARSDARPFEHFIGWQSQSDLPALLRAADILAFPTVAEEALGRTAVEAMAVGTPVVASRIGGLPWVVEDGRQGLLCDPGDAEDLAKKLHKLLGDPDLRKRLGESGQERFASMFTWDHVVEAHYVPLFGPAEIRC